MSSRQKAIYSAITKIKETHQYLLWKANKIYPRRISVNYKFHRLKKLRIK